MELEEAIRASIGVTEDEMQQLTQKLQHHIQPVNASTDGQANGIYLMGVSTTQCFIMTDSARSNPLAKANWPLPMRAVEASIGLRYHFDFYHQLFKKATKAQPALRCINFCKLQNLQFRFLLHQNQRQL